MVDVNVWVDPVCPWSWLTAGWLREVERVRPVRPRFRQMSLSVLNEGRDDVADFYREGVVRWWGPTRVFGAGISTGGERVLRPLYEALGSRIHLEGEPYGTELYRAALDEVRLPVDLAEAADTDRYDDEIRARHREAAVVDGDEDLGVPTLHLPGRDGQPVAFHGPVVNPAPSGEDAGALWDALVALAPVPGFGEIRRTRPGAPILA